MSRRLDYPSVGSYRMRRIRCSIANLLLVVLFTGIALAALRSGSALWGSLLFTAAVAALLVAVVGAVYCRDQRRAFWLGFALFGWGYLLLGLVPEARSQLATTALLDVLHARVFGRSEPAQFTWSWSGRVNTINNPAPFSIPGTQPPDTEPFKIQDLFLRHSPFSPGGAGMPYNIPSTPDVYQLPSEETWLNVYPPTTTGNLMMPSAAGLESFQRIGHSLFSLVFAMLGGVLAQRVAFTSRSPESREP